MTTITTTTAAGTVFTLDDEVADFPRLFPGRGWSGRRPGTHLVFLGLTASDCMIRVWNTATGRVEAIMAERWVLDRTRIVGTADIDTDHHLTLEGDDHDDVRG